MLEILSVILFGWLFIKAIGFSLKVAWCAAKVAGLLLFVLALPVLVLCLVFASGAILLAPVLMVALGCAILSSC